MEIQKVAIIPNTYSKGKKKTRETHDIVSKVAKQVEKKLNSIGVETFLPASGDFPQNICDETIKKSDLVIALGGDGTIIHTAKKVSVFKKTVLGINCGSLGFMAGLERDELDLLDSIFKNNFKEETELFQRRMMLNVSIKSKNEGEKNYTALNEAAISRDALSSMINFEISNKREPVTAYNADGVILATPTGSTAYSLSAGGPIVDPDVECILFTPICAHSLFARSYIFSKDDEITVKVMNADLEKSYLSVDGEEGVEIKKGDIIKVKRSDYYANMLMITEKPFYNTLNKKLVHRR